MTDPSARQFRAWSAVIAKQTDRFATLMPTVART
jgi:hypothetical protein